MTETIINLLPVDLFPEMYKVLIVQLIAFALMIIFAIIGNVAARHLIVRFIRGVVKKTKNQWDDVFVKRGVFLRLSHLAPAMVVYSMGPMVFEGQENFISFVTKLSHLYMILTGLLFVDSILNAALEIYNGFKVSKKVPLRSFFQVAKIFIYFVGVIFMISLIVGQSPLKLMAGLGAMTAVLMLVFKDPILGFVAGIQLTTNKMLAIGDWVEMPSIGLDADVMELGLTTVKLRNYDKTITTVPTAAFINKPFKNWTGMTESGVRRIKRSISIDMNTIRFCDEEMTQRFSKIQYISEYLETKVKELDAYNTELKVDVGHRANGRHLTNIGTFRAYVEAYLHNNPVISKEMTFLIRQLKSTETGVPIEIYVFSKEQAWVKYEGIVSDIFDHLLAVVPEFDLRVYQSPSGHDLSQIGMDGLVELEE
ncbi:mechanosensitive ion channel family protein [Verrucomicrobia bacterium]|nr:mechanosensitive ion channel family protein [Verrucomicrobiota bacterium]